jgi:hypothetical protein
MIVVVGSKWKFARFHWSKQRARLQTNGRKIIDLPQGLNRPQIKLKRFGEGGGEQNRQLIPCFILNLSVTVKWVKLGTSSQDFQDFYNKKNLEVAMAWQTWPDKLLAHQSQAHWQRGTAGVSTCTPLSLIPTPFLNKVPGSQNGLYQWPKGRGDLQVCILTITMSAAVTEGHTGKVNPKLGMKLLWGLI